MLWVINRKLLVEAGASDVCPEPICFLWRNICSSDMYMIHLYCLAVQASFYNDAVECRTFESSGPGLIGD